MNRYISWERRTLPVHRLLVRTLAAGTLFVLVLAGCARTTEPVVVDDLLLGTYVRIAVHGGTTERPLLDAAMDRVAEVERKMSVSTADYEETELLRVNRAAGQEPIPVSEETLEVVKAALAYSEATGGAFNVAVEPLVSLWGIGTDDERVPSELEIEATLPLVDYSAVVVDGDAGSLYLPEEGMGLDVGGIAKGYAADEAAAILRDGGVTSALLDFGGNILVIGEKPDGSAWRVGIQRPDAERAAYLGILSIRDATVVTSGPYERFFVQDEVRYHHILDSQTGFPAAAGLEQVTIVAERSIDADALSTACFVLGLGRATELIEARPGVEAIFVDTEGRVFLTSGIGTDFELTDANYTLSD